MGNDPLALQEFIMVGALRYLVVACIGFSASQLSAQTVYKSVDEKGNVTYSENPPASGKDGKIRSTKELPIDPNQNVVPAIVPLNLPPLNTEQQNAGTAGNDADEVSQARAALEEAEAQLKAGADVQPGDFMGKAGGGVRPSPERLQRLEELQRQVEEARKNLKEVSGE
jgi:hypothetical protein